MLCVALLLATTGWAGVPAHVPGRLAVELLQPALSADQPPETLLKWAKARGMTLRAHFPSSDGTTRWSRFGLGCWWLLDTPLERDIPALCDSLARLPGVKSAVPDWVTHMSTTPNDPLFPNQWALQNTGQARNTQGALIGQPGLDLGVTIAWDLGSEEHAPQVAVLDTGVDPNHLEFHNRLLPGFNFLTNLPGAVDDNGHGTSVASLACALVNNQTGLAGLSRQARILPLKVLNSIGMGSASALANGLNYALQLHMDVANFSGGMSQEYGPIGAVIEAGRAEGMWTVAAAGNDGVNGLEYPARLPACVGVGAMSPCGEPKTPQSCDGEGWWGSNTGPGLDLLAPGVRLTAASLGGGYRSDFNGSSAACAYASGALAFLRGVDPGASLEEIEDALQETARDLGVPGYDPVTGHGLPQVDEALMRLVPLRVQGLTIQRQGGRVLLHWNPLPTALRYRIEARVDSHSPFQTVATTTSTNWQSGPLELMRPSRQYRVVALLSDLHLDENQNETPN